MTVAIGPQVLVAPTDGAHAPAVIFTLESAHENRVSSDRTPWQDLRLFGSGRHARNFKSGAEQIGDVYL